MINLHIVYALLVAFFVGGIAGYLGSLMLTKRMVLMGGALGHLTMPGISLALLYGFDVSLGAFLFLGLGIVLIWFLGQKTRLPIEALTAVVFASSLAIAFLVLPEEKSMPALIGDISHISIYVALIALCISIAVFCIIRRMYSGLILASISSDIAQSTHINVTVYNFIYLLCIAVVVALGVRIVGGLMTAALLAIPACTSKNMSKDLKQYAYGSIAVGSISCVSGVILSLVAKVSAGPLIILSSSFLFVCSLLLSRIFYTKA